MCFNKSLAFIGLFYWITLISVCAQGLGAEKAELIYSSTVDKVTKPQVAIIQNNGIKTITIRNVDIVGIDASSFKLQDVPQLPLKLRAKEKASFSVVFAPDEETGFLKAILQVNGSNIKKNATILLAGLSAEGLEGENEPSLHQVVLTLGYAVEVGDSKLKLGTGEEPLGEEELAPVFVKANEGNVTILPVARYSPPGKVPFGYYVYNDNIPELIPVGILTDTSLQHQTLLPERATGSESFDPGQKPFGLYTETKEHKTYTEDRLNTGVKHAVRIYPLRNRRGDEIRHQYLVCFEEAQNGDYQDFVFVITNVKPVGE